LQKNNIYLLTSRQGRSLEILWRTGCWQSSVVLSAVTRSTISAIYTYTYYTPMNIQQPIHWRMRLYMVCKKLVTKNRNFITSSNTDRFQKLFFMHGLSIYCSGH